MGFKRPCLDCGSLTDTGNRCPTHKKIQQAKIDDRREPRRQHYKGNYKARAKLVRETATICWLCNKGPITGDPWTADHYYPGQSNSPLLPAHRSCNSRRKNKQPDQ